MQHTFFKKSLHNLLVLISFILCLGADSCSQCKKMPEGEPFTKEVVVEIVPLKTLSLIGKEDKTIHFKLQQAKNSAAVDLAKLRLKITTVSTPASEVSQIQYKSDPISELVGNQIRLDQEIKLELVTTNATEQVDITLELVYEDKPMKGVNNSQTFTWEKMNDVTEKLFAAISANKKDEAIALLDKGNIQVHATNHSGNTFLREAIEHSNDPAVIEKLINIPGMDLYAKSSWSKDSPLELTIGEGRLDIFKMLLAKGVQVPAGTTILHLVIEKNKVDFIKYVLEKYENLKDSQDKEGNTPLHLATNIGFPKLVNFLLKKGADRSIKNKAEKTPEQIATEMYQQAKSKNPADTSYDYLMGAFKGTYTDSL